MRRKFEFLLSVFFSLTLAVSTEVNAATKKTSTSSEKSSATSSKAAARPVAKATPTPAAAFDENGVPIVSAASVVVLDADSGRILHIKNGDAVRQAASTQKLLTALVILDEGNLDRKVVVQESDTWAEPSKLDLAPGDTYSRRQMLEILLVRSMNDVARALARDNAGSIEAFAEKMNHKARDLGAVNSCFKNPNGLPVPGQYSTARDLSRIALVAYRNPIIRDIVCRQFLSFQYCNGRLKTFENTNRLLGHVPYCNGMKTGYTDAAGKCLIASGRAGGRNVIAVLLGDSSKYIWRDASALLTWGLSS